MKKTFMVVLYVKTFIASASKQRKPPKRKLS